jgi:hypothetical protein
VVPFSDPPLSRLVRTVERRAHANSFSHACAYTPIVERAACLSARPPSDSPTRRRALAQKTTMEEDWLTQLLEEQGAPGALKVDETNPQAGPVREPSSRGKRAVGVGGNSYITPPTLRKTEAVPANAAALAAGRVPVIAVKVTEEVPEEIDSTEGQSVSSRQSVSPSSEVLAWDSSTSCVPPGAAWVTMVQPPRREKRARKVGARRTRGAPFARAPTPPPPCSAVASPPAVTHPLLPPPLPFKAL